MCGRPAKFGCVDFWLTARHSVAVHTLNYLHAQLQVHTLNYRELSAHSGTRVSALDFTNVAMGRLAVGSRGSMTGTAPLNRRPAGIACVIGTPGLNSSDYIRVHAGQGERRGRSSVCLGQTGQPRTTGKRPWRPTHRHLRRLLHAGYPDAARSRLAYTRLIRALV